MVRGVACLITYPLAAAVPYLECAQGAGRERNLYFLRGLIHVSDREMRSLRFEIEIHEYIYLAIPPSRRLAVLRLTYNHASLF